MAKFKARARALDMLGRQQIAGRPTAISELFKNAHDAYADRVEVDFFRSNRLFVLRDDGIGMTESDFLERWLVLGTESKVTSPHGLAQPAPPAGAAERPLLGEKGIGRLAIASIGRVVLVLTRAKRDKADRLVAALIPWGVFECPGLDLDQVDIPVRTFAGSTLPSAKDIAALVAEADANIVLLADEIDPAYARKLRKEIASFHIDIQATYNDLGGLSLSGSGCGTHFFILPADDNLIADIDDATKDNASPLQKTLIGFTHQMRAGLPPPRLQAAFRYHRPEGVEDLIGEQSFFGQSEFESADHNFVGDVDEYGRFTGSARIFEETVSLDVASPAGNRKPTECGPFSFGFAYVQGEPKDSLLYSRDPEAWSQLYDRVQRLGGLYVYRDGIRVLPYGDNTHDFLGIEERRNKGASYYFFSYRRMFGTIELTRAANGELHEKAGREGFRENKAFRQFKEIGKNILIQIAAELFRADGPRTELYQKQREAYERLELVRREREAHSRKKRADFDAQTAEVLARLAAGEAQTATEALLEAIASRLRDAQATEESDEAGRRVLEAEADARRQLEQLRSSYRIAKPRGVGLNKRLRRDYESYLSEMEAIEADVFTPAEERIDVLVEGAARAAKVAVSRRRRAESALEGAVVAARRHVRDERIQVDKNARDLNEQVVRLTRDAILETEGAISRAIATIAELDVSALSESQFARRRRAVETSLADQVEHQRELLGRMREVIAWASVSLQPGAAASPDELTEALEEELLSLQERQGADLDLTQLGMAIELINHEFAATIRTVRTGLQNLGEWAKSNKLLQPMHRELRTAFDNLDGYLTLFTPLHRRLYRKRVPLAGSSVSKYVGDLFAERFRRHGITFNATPAFQNFTFTGYPSSFFPVFVNLADNAVFWLDGVKGQRVLCFDAAEGRVIISDSGRGIPRRDRDHVFERGFSRKPGGRGLGLYISREVLKREGFALVLGDQQPKAGTRFVIEPLTLGKPDEKVNR